MPPPAERFFNMKFEWSISSCHHIGEKYKIGMSAPLIMSLAETMLTDLNYNESFQKFQDLDYWSYTVPLNCALCIVYPHSGPNVNDIGNKLNQPILNSALFKYALLGVELQSLVIWCDQESRCSINSWRSALFSKCLALDSNASVWSLRVW